MTNTCFLNPSPSHLPAVTDVRSILLTPEVGPRWLLGCDHSSESRGVAEGETRPEEALTQGTVTAGVRGS